MTSENNRYVSGNNNAGRRELRKMVLLICVFATFSQHGDAQGSLPAPLPFEVSNPKHLKWSADDAGRIYASACELVARHVRPDKPPRLTPKFVLVLGTPDDETVRNDALVEVHLKAWNSVHFAEAMVLIASREILKNDDVIHLTRDTLMAAQASVSVNELKDRQ